VTFESIPSRLFKQAKNNPDNNAYFVRTDGDWVPTNYAEEIMIMVTASDVDGASISDTFVFRHVVRTGLVDQ
jgi:hypothetical protein